MLKHCPPPTPKTPMSPCGRGSEAGRRTKLMPWVRPQDSKPRDGICRTIMFSHVHRGTHSVDMAVLMVKERNQKDSCPSGPDRKGCHPQSLRPTLPCFRMCGPSIPKSIPGTLKSSAGVSHHEAKRTHGKGNTHQRQNQLPWLCARRAWLSRGPPQSESLVTLTSSYPLTVGHVHFQCGVPTPY